MIVCRRCGASVDYIKYFEEDFELHHLIPKTIGGTDKDGRKYLCKKCHKVLHGTLLRQVFKCVPEEEKQNCRNKVKEFSLWFIENTK